MPSAFVRTLRSVELDSHRPAFALGLAALPLLGGWLAWATLSRAPVYAITSQARTEIEGSVVPVDVDEPGRVVLSNLTLGKHVHAGDVLLELDTTLDDVRREEIAARRDAALERRQRLDRVVALAHARAAARDALTDADAEARQLDAQLRAINLQIERRTIRAMSAGYLGDVTPVTVGVTVVPGRPLATIIPEGDVHMVAYFPAAEAVGRVRIGQRCQLRFRAFPWTQFGVVGGDVTSAFTPPKSANGRDGGVRVEIAIDRATTAKIPLQHGMPATAEILVARATPWQLLLQTVGGLDTKKPSDDAAASPEP